MNNFQYQNIEEILNSNIPIRGSRYIVSQDRRVIVPVLNVVDDQINNISKDSFEMHLFYSDGGYVGSLYDIKNWKVDDENDPSNLHLKQYSAFNPSKLNCGADFPQLHINC